MQLGLLTAPFGDTPLEKVIEWAGIGLGGEGFDALEVVAGPGARHIDVDSFTPDDAARLLSLLGEARLSFSSLANYCNTAAPDEDERARTLEALKRTVDCAALLKVDVVCTLAGMPLPGKSREETIKTVSGDFFKALCDYAGEKGVKIALENWYATNICGLHHFDLIFETVDRPNFGLNFDPSHLVWQGIDHLQAVDEFKDRLFHTHAKDVEISTHKLRRLGNQSRGWWRYVIPGFGEIDWGRYIGALRQAGYDGVLSIEHEDASQSREEGFVRGLEYLSLFV